MKRKQFFYWCFSILALAFTLISLAQTGAVPSAEQIIQNNIRTLAAIRANPQVKSQSLSRLKDKLTNQGVDNVDARITEVGKIIDQAIAMSQEEFEKNQQQLAQKVLSQMKGGQASGTANSMPSLFPAEGKQAGKKEEKSQTTKSQENIPWIDVHNHLVQERGEKGVEYEGAVSSALAAFEGTGLSRMIVMPTPGVSSMIKGNAGRQVMPTECEYFAPYLKNRPQFVFLGGGGSLNIMLHDAKDPKSVTSGMKKDFEQKANEILKQGAVGFGEMAIQHLSLHGTEHPYESVSADHPLLFLLADIAAKHDVPIDIHLDVVAEDIKKPEWLESPNNPNILKANLAGFEKLLNHNPRAKICWAHAGSDNIGQWTVELSRKMLKMHPNLYMSLRVGTMNCFENFPLDNDGKLRPEWLSLFQDYPTRFVIGSDRFFSAVNTQGTGTGAMLGSKSVGPVYTKIQLLLKQLPPDLAKKIATENAMALYKIK